LKSSGLATGEDYKNYLDLNPASYAKISPSTSNFFALYPSVLMLRLSIDDLQSLKEVKFDWKLK
jgi:hypothetical protein